MDVIKAQGKQSDKLGYADIIMKKIQQALRDMESEARSSRQGRRGWKDGAAMCRRRWSKSVLKLYYLAVKAYRSKLAEKNT